MGCNAPALHLEHRCAGVLAPAEQLGVLWCSVNASSALGCCPCPSWPRAQPRTGCGSSAGLEGCGMHEQCQQVEQELGVNPDRHLYLSEV